VERHKSQIEETRLDVKRPLSVTHPNDKSHLCSGSDSIPANRGGENLLRVIVDLGCAGGVSTLSRSKAESRL